MGIKDTSILNTKCNKRVHNFLTSLNEKTLFRVALFLTYFRAYLFSESAIHNLFGVYNHFLIAVFMFIAYSCLLLKVISEIINEGLTYKYYLGILLLIFAFILEKRNGTNWILNLWLFILCSKNIDGDDIAKPVFWALLSVVIPTIVLSYINVIENCSNMKNNTTIVYSFGFYNSNTVAEIISMEIAINMYVIRKNLKLWIFFFLAIIVFFVWKKTHARAALITNCILILGVFCSYILAKKGFDCYRLFTLSKVISLLILALMIVLSVAVVLRPNLFSNVFFSKRISTVTAAFSKYKIKLFGQLIPAIETEYGLYYLDMGYLHLILRFGIVYSFLFIASYSQVILKTNWNDGIVLLIILSTFFILGFVETNILRWRYNFTLYFMGPAFWNTQDSIKSKLRGNEIPV